MGKFQIYQYIRAFLLVLLLSVGSFLQGEDCLDQQFYFGPECYDVLRIRAKTSHQQGGVYGARIGYDRVQGSKLYWGVNALLAGGTLQGKTKAENKLKSHFTDWNAEARLGYTFETKICQDILFTPFLGYGYAEEKNNFVHPTTLPVHFKIYYQYACAGFLSQLFFLDRWSVGFNFKALYPLDARNRVSNDPDYEAFTMKIQEKLHYRLELPFTYQCRSNLWLQAIPIYEYRQYGKQANYPFDFLETRLRIYGGALRIRYLF